MQILVETDHNITGRAAMADRVRAVVEAALGRFGAQITRVEVHLSDENAQKHGADDKRCVMEARLQGRRPVAVTHLADDLDKAVNGAADKLARLLDSTLGRLRNPKRRGGPALEPAPGPEPGAPDESEST